MDEKDIQMSGAKSIGELLANEPGIDWQTYGNYGGAPQEIPYPWDAGQCHPGTC